MSQIYRQQRKFDLARQALDKASELAPDDLEIKLNESLLLEDEGKLSEAIVALKQIIDATAKKTYSKAERDYRAGMLERLGTLYRNLEQYDQAADAFRQIESLDPDVASRAEAQIIDTYRLGKDFAKAQQLSDAAAKKYPNDRTLLAVRASLLADLGKADEAAAELKKTLGGKDDRETYLTLAQVYDKSHNYTEMAKALDAAEKLSTSKEDKVTIYFMRGAMYERQKKLDLGRETVSGCTCARSPEWVGTQLSRLYVRRPEHPLAGSAGVDREGRFRRAQQRRVSGQPGMGLLSAEQTQGS